MSQRLVNFFDDLGISLLCRPMRFVHTFEFLNFLDDMGIELVIRPLGYLHLLSAVMMRKEKDELTCKWV
jgi:hypothetical protein